MKHREIVRFSVVLVAAGVIGGCSEPRSSSPQGVVVAADENDVQVTIDQVPAAVRDAILARLNGGTVHEIERSTTNGVTRYEVEIANATGATSEFVLANDGALLREGDDDDDGDDDDGEDDDDHDDGDDDDMN
jgi:hypothetical protein